MSDRELADLIHNSVSDVFNKNLDMLHTRISSLISISKPLTKEELNAQTESLLRYTTLIAELSCTAMSKTLSSLGILDISSTDS